MRRIGAQNYIVAREDFPITIEVEAFDLAVFQCELSEVVVTRSDNSIVTTFELPITPIQGNPLLGRATIPDPSDAATPSARRYDPPADVSFTLVVGYDTPNGKDPRYEIRLEAGSGDSPPKRTRQPPILKATTNLIYR